MNHFTILPLVLLIILSFKYTDCVERYGVGHREKGDRILFRKRLISGPSVVPINHTITYEYFSTERITFVEMATKNNMHAELIITADDSLRIIMTAINCTDFFIALSMYGFDRDAEKNLMPPGFESILKKRPHKSPKNPLIPREQHIFDKTPRYVSNYRKVIDTVEFGLGERQPDDQILYSGVHESKLTQISTLHNITFRYNTPHFITAVLFNVDSQEASANFTLVTEHAVKVIIYEDLVNQLSSNITVYGFKENRKPWYYRRMSQLLLDGAKMIEKGVNVSLDNMEETAEYMACRGHSSIKLTIHLLHFMFILLLIKFLN